jgi:curved DNA-binding protein CbpA
MPKAYDVKHNYCTSLLHRLASFRVSKLTTIPDADLDLPTTASCDDVKKQYRKLALQYHPDRNAGKEEEYIPKFQAIQAAHEILGEPGEKSRYDGDRRKAGLYPTTGGGGSSSGGTRGNPYQATSAYPPPPRRTQPGTYQRPQAAGADRFTNFPRPAPTAKRPDPAAERQNAFKAWQNMNNAQDRQQQQQQQQQQARYAQASPQPQAKPATPRRPVPPPRADPKFPAEEKIRAGFNYREAPHSTSADGAEERQSAWAAFQASRGNANSPGVKRSNTNKTPRKGGFDPNMPGSDEGMAPDSQYAHRHKSADFGRPGAAPPPPPRPSQPASPMMTPQRPHADPLRPFRARTHTAEGDAPYSEGNRVRTPYSSFSGERTDFGGDMRRSNSTRDAFKLNPESNDSRARSTSPLGRSSSGKSGEGQQRRDRPSFSVGGSSSTSSDSSEHDTADTPEQRRGPFALPGKTSVPLHDRPKIVPSPPSRRFNGSNPTTSTPANGNGVNDAEMKQKSSSSMYVTPLPSKPQHSPFTLEDWAKRMFGTKTVGNTPCRNRSIPKWAIPSSVLPQRKSAKRGHVGETLSTLRSVKPKTEGMSLGLASTDEQDAYSCFRRCLELSYHSVPSSLDINVFLMLASTARSGKLLGMDPLDRALSDTLALYPTVGNKLDETRIADNKLHLNRFSMPVPPNMFTSHTSNGKSRSEESINTKFSADGWSGTFNGSSEYFAPPQATSRRGSPSLRGGQRPSMRPTTSSFGQSASAAQSPSSAMPPPPPPFAGPQGSAFPELQSAGSDTKFSKDQWEQTFKDGSWTFPPPPSMPPTSPVKGGARSRPASRKNSRAAHTRPPSAPTGSAANPHVVDEEDDQTVDPRTTAHTAPADEDAGIHEPDAMDIDNTPPATEQSYLHQSNADKSKEPRLVSVPPSAWRQSQQPHNSNSHHRTTSGGTNNGPLRANLNDLANVAPFAQSSEGSGLQNFNSMSETLPFTSQAANTLPTNPLKPQTLSTPVVPIPPKAPTRLSKQSWHQYAQNFGVYLHAFNSFNSAMLQHFQARDQQAVARMQKGMAWLEATGDPIAGGGFGTYAREVREDERVRETWNMGCERQADAVKEFDELRERVRRQAVAGKIPEQ